MSIAKKSLTELAQMVNDGLRPQPVVSPEPVETPAALPTWFAIDPSSPRVRPQSRFAIKTARGVKWLH